MNDPRVEMSLVALLDVALQTFASRTACVSLGHSTTYGELDRFAQAWANWLGSLALPPQSRVAIMLPNVTASLVVLLGTLRAGHVVVNVNPLYTPRELAAQLRDSQSQVVVVFETFAQTLQQLPVRDQPPHQVVVRPGDLLPTLKSSVVNFVARHIKRSIPPWKLTRAQALSAVLRAGEAQPAYRPRISPDDLAFIQYTGGTTGEPRGAMLSHRNLVANILQVGLVAQPALGHRLHEPLTMLTALPLYHVFAMTVCALYSLHAGMKIVLVINGRDIPSLLKTWQAHPPTVFPGVNTLFAAMLRHPQFKFLDFSDLEITLGGGMAVHESVAQQWQAVSGKTIVQGYGMSETSPVICANPTNTTTFSGTVGAPLPWTSVRILDAQHASVGVREVGEIAVQGPQVMRGYWRNESASAEVMTRDGYFLTGDLGFFDEQGCVTIVDRKKDMILVSGFNVYPAELDAVFAEHPDVLDCAAVGYPDLQTGESIRLFVVPRVQNVDIQALRQWSQQRLTPYKRPREIVLVDHLPKNAVGKTLRRMLRQTYP